MITQQNLKEILHYDPETGHFTYRVNRARMAKAGQRAGAIHYTQGYNRLHLEGKFYNASTLAVLYMTGSRPAEMVDHINGVRDDDRWVNLREVTRAENGLNRQTYETNTSGFKGVCWHQKLQKWRARIGKHGKRYALGCFDTKEEAYAAYLKAADEMFGEFNRRHMKIEERKRA